MSERIRVMRVIARMNVGGPAIQVSGLMRTLDSQRFDQRLYTGWCAPDEADYLQTQAPDVTAHRVDGLGRAVRPGDDVLAIARLHAAIKEFRPHILHTHTAKAGALVRSLAIATRSQSLLVHTFHGHLLHGYFSPGKTRALVHFERALARRTARIVAVGPQVRDDLLAAGIGRASQYVVIPPGLEFPPPPTREQARAELGIADSTFVVSLIGRLTAIKRPDRFAEMAALVHQQLPAVDICFLVAGEGEQADALAAAAQAHDLPIRMLGWRADVPRLLAATDVLVLTSDNEGTPISLIQAAMAQIPVVATNVGSVKDVVLDGITGKLVDTTAAALAEQVLSLHAQPQLRSQMGLAGREHAQHRYSAQRLASDHASLYESMLAARMSR